MGNQAAANPPNLGTYKYGGIVPPQLSTRDTLERAARILANDSAQLGKADTAGAEQLAQAASLLAHAAARLHACERAEGDRAFERQSDDTEYRG